MNPHHPASSALVFLVMTAFAHAGTGSAVKSETASPVGIDPARDHRHPGYEGRSEFGVPLGRLLEMDDVRLARVRGLIERIEKMPPPERAELRRRLQSSGAAPVAEREAFHRELRERLGVSEPGEKPREGKVSQGKPGAAKAGGGRPVRDLLEKHFATMSPEQAKAEKEKFLSMPRDAKMVYLKGLREKYGLPIPTEKPAQDESMRMRPDSRPGAPAAAPAPKPSDRDDPFHS